jgi:glyoxylase-like metal-dependent hydrolase (beta-lactamase superfamily II)
MELFPNVYQIQSIFGGRNLFQYLFVGDKVVLIDSGIAETPEKVIFPYMDGLKISPQRLTLAVTTHPDLDHQGGNDAIKRFAPAAWLSCGEADRAMVEDPQTLFERRYNYMREEHEVGFDLETLPLAGKKRRMDVTFSGGETIGLADDWSLDVLHVPGHSHGHLALYDRKHKAVYASDALHGRGCPKADGTMGIPVTYYYVDVYLSTLRYFESLDMDVFYSGHFPAMQGEEIANFISESRQTVELFDRVILRELGHHPEGLRLEQLIDAVANAVGDWPKDTWVLAMFPVKGHLDRLEQQGKIRPIAGARPGKWQLA